MSLDWIIVRGHWSGMDMQLCEKPADVRVTLACAVGSDQAAVSLAYTWAERLVRCVGI
jgi:hypothetical protein